MSLASVPGPKGIPILGMDLEFSKDPFAYAKQVGRFRPVAAVPFPGMKLVYVLEPELVEQVLVRESKRFRKGAFMSRVEIVFGEGILLAEGDAWKQQRRRMAPAFTKKAVREMSEAIGPLAVERLEDWKDGEVRDLHVDMMGLTLEVVLRVLFGTGASGDDLATVRTAFHDIAEHFAGLSELVVSIPLWVPTPGNLRFKRARADLDGVVSRILGERRASGEHGTDLLGRMLTAADSEGTPLDEAQLQDEVRTLLLAGHETTAVALTTACFMLAQHPDSQAWAHQELDAIEGPITVDTPLPRLSAILDEAMRLFPPAPVFPREPIEDVQLGEHTIPAGTTLIIPPFILHHDERFFAEPEVWKPERWTPELRDALPRFAYFPFGGGPRICIGVHLALAEARIVLAELLRRHTLSPAPGAAMKLVPSITMRPSEPVEVVAHRR
mgnify:CR=1 FL=1